MNCEDCKELIVTIVKKGWSERVIKASRSAGAEGGTIMMGRGTGIHETQSLLGLPIEPEKEIILTIVNCDQTDTVLTAIEAGAELALPGNGVAFVLPIRKVVGRVHMFRKGEDSEGACNLR
jgi:nitrogen regulatory protein P-II 1